MVAAFGHFALEYLDALQEASFFVDYIVLLGVMCCLLLLGIPRRGDYKRFSSVSH